MRSILIVVVCAFGCGKGKDPRFEGPMPITLGACAGPTVKFVSGPRPLPFTPQDIEATGKTAAKPAAKPPEPPPDESGGTGTAMALDEGKMGAKDARQAVLDEARRAGILATPSSEQNSTGSSISADSSGFGRRKDLGFGAGGWGTIGTGRYGTIGDRDGAVPTVSMGQPKSAATLDKEVIRRYIRRNLQKITYCYEKQLLSNPSLAGTIDTTFFITPTGAVATANATGFNPEVAKCVADVIRAIEFPKPQGGRGVQVNYPFTFRPAGSDAKPTTAPAAGSDAGSNTGSAAGSAAAAAPPIDAHPPEPSSGNDGHDLFRSADAPYVDSVHYNPANENPFVDQEPALEECFRRSPTHYGVVVIELKYDAAGRVTDAKVDGNDDARTRACLVAASKLVKHSGVTAENCGIAFGDMPVTDLPAIDITANTIVFGTLRIPTNTILSDDSPTKKIADLEATVAATVQTAMAAPVSLYGPIVVRPEDATPMKVVFRVLGSVLAGGDDFVLAEHRGAGWEPLYKMTLPIVPVPIGTGGKWNPVKGQGRNGTSTLDDEHVTLSVLIEKDRMWIGLSRVNEFQEVPHDAMQADKLVATLKEQKASAFFADRSDIEIAADDDVPYSDVLAVIAKAREVGFFDWQLTDPAGLAARPTL